MHILLLSAYDTASHRSWCQGLMSQMSHFQWTYMALPGRYFGWRIRGNPLSWSMGKEAAKLHQRFDLIIATSMVDLATLKGLIPSLAVTPAIVYFHENQFAYPVTQHQHTSLEPQMVNLYSAMAANKVVFNSAFNRDSFLQGVSDLLDKLPDHAPRQLVEQLTQKSCVVPVPLSQPEAVSEAEATRPDSILRLVWNHRWEYDKGPDALAITCRLIDELQLPIQVWILGQEFRSAPKAFDQLRKNTPKCIQHMGHLPQYSDYQACLRQADVVLSTALHEFQGLAVLEAAQLGCVPLVPDRLAYPEWVPNACRFSSQPTDPNAEAQAIVLQLKQWLEQGLPTCPDVTAYGWNQLLPQYDKLLSEVAANPVISV